MFILNTIHEGKLVKQRLKEEGRSITWLANKLCCHVRTIYKILSKKHITPDLMLQIATILEWHVYHVYDELIEKEIERKREKERNKRCY
ncbi:MAG: hypothetical protein LBR51_03720 [Bacteroidales bacterium]|jgi:plasmid maintenance system antidote protein VapI|nr:hypothetical protein [Bacteroidales bacterium]